MDKKPTVGDVYLLDDLVSVLDSMEDLEKAEADRSIDAAEPQVDVGGSDASGGDGDEVPVDGAGALEFNIQVQDSRPRFKFMFRDLKMSKCWNLES